MIEKQNLSADSLNVLKRDSETALKKLYFELYQELYYYGLKLSGSEEIAKDCIQDLFLQFWSDNDQLNHVNSKKAYLLKCLRRRILSFMMKERKIQYCEDDLDYRIPSMESAEDDILRAESEKILEQRLRKAKSELTVRQQEVLYLRYSLGFNFEVICDIMDIKYQSVRNLLGEAVKLLRIKLNTGTVFK